MAEQQSGLRFDIFERVHLTEEVDGIESLEEIELVPHIELSTQGQQTVLKGYLQLAGRYTSARSQNQSEGLEHRIPVNISMPSERIENVNELGVEIDHFDIDLLSSRMLNVTGVLYLRGVQAAETRPSKPEQTEQEEMFFVHQAADAEQPEVQAGMRHNEAADEPVPPQFPQQFTRQAEEPQQPSSNLQAEAASENAGQPVQSANEQKESNVTAPMVQENAPTAQANKQPEPLIEAQSEQQEPNKKAEVAAESMLLEAEENASQEKSEMKIAFSGKKTTSNDLLNAAELQSMLQNKEHPNEAAAQSAEKKRQAERETENESSEQSISDRVQWKNLFLPKEEDETQQFRKLRMCIVQKEETLDSIAERYSLNPREILLYNRLGEQQEVSEGQVIYIPKTS